MNTRRLLNHVLALIWLAASLANAENIFWSSPLQKTNLASSGQNMDAACQFQLGVFTGGFVPTVRNLSQWSSHWAPAQSASYDSTTRSFDSNFTVTGNAAPFSIGAKAYVWLRSLGNPVTTGKLISWKFVSLAKPEFESDFNTVPGVMILPVSNFRQNNLSARIRVYQCRSSQSVVLKSLMR